MKWLGYALGAMVVVFGLSAGTGIASAGSYWNNSLNNHGKSARKAHKVRIKYRRRFGRRYGRRISTFVRIGPYAARRNLRRYHVKKRRHFR